MAEQFANNAASTLNGAINNSTTTIVVATGEGSRFPSVGNFRLLIGLDPFTAEIVLATARSGDTLTVVRGQEGSSAQSWGNGTAITHIMTAGAIEQIRTQFTTISNEIYTTNTVSVDPNGTVASAHGDGTAKLYVNGKILGTTFSAGEIPLTTQTFSYVSDTLQSFVVPTGVTSVKVKMWGPGGGTGNYSSAGGGGPGGYSTGLLSVTPGETLYIAVGSGGKKPTSSNPGPGGLGGWPGGGFGTAGDASGGGGGGFSGIFTANSITQANALIVAGGGGGSTGFGNFAAGAGGGLTAGGATSGTGVTGRGGTQSAGGADGNGNAAASTAIASGSNGIGLPTGTINVDSTSAFPTSGVLLITTDAGIQIVRYTGKTATTFTGCTGGTGTMSTGGAVIYAIAGSAFTGGIAFSDRTSFQPTGSDCGGGGSGYFGGGAGQSDGRAGGGGSGFLHATRITSGVTTTGSNAASGSTTTAPPNSTDVNYSAGVGVGAAASGTGNDGGNGYVVLQWGGITTLDLDSIDFGNTSSISTLDTNMTISPATNGVVSLSAPGSSGSVTLAPTSGLITLSSPTTDISLTSGTSNVLFNMNSAQKFKIYSSGAIVIGGADAHNDTSVEAQANITGPVINLSSSTGTFNSTANQALIFNQSGSLNLQGNTDIRFNTSSSLKGYFDSGGILRVGPSASTSATLQGASAPFANSDYFYMYNSGGSAWAEIIAGTTNTRAALQVMNVGAGGTSTVGVSLFSAGTAHATAEYAGNGIIEQVGASTSGLIFTKVQGNATNFASTGAIWQSGAWTIGRATNNDTSSEAQAGLTGPLLNITQTTGGSLSTVANQALLYNTGGVNISQGNLGVRQIVGTTTILDTTSTGIVITGNATATSKFIVGASGPTITQGTGTPSASEANGSIFLRTDGSVSSGIYTRQGGVWSTINSRYTPTDSNTIINWKFDETASPYVNSGSGSALSLTTFSGTPFSITGLFNKALGCFGTIISTGNTSVNQPSGTSVTVSAWVKARSYASFGTVINKAYRNDNTWSTPFVSLYLSLSNLGDGSWGPAITTTGGVLTQPSIGGAYRVPIGVWTLLSYTYDGSNLRSYINGALANTTAVSGAIDYGTSGPWDIGGVSNAGVNQYWDGHIDDVRVENVVRSQAYFETMYKNGIGQPD